MLYTQQQYKQFSSLSSKMIEKGIANNDHRIRLAALLAAGDKRLPMRGIYLETLLDTNALVRQAGRRNLIILSAVHLNPESDWITLARKNKLKFVDFGPPPCCKLEEAQASKELWTTWFEEELPKSPLLKPLDKTKFIPQ